MRAIEKSETVRSHCFSREGRVQPYLNRRLSMFEALILSSRVEGDIPSLTAAPDGPETRPLVSASAASIISRALCGLASPLKATDVATRDAGRGASLESHNSSTENASPAESQTSQLHSATHEYCQASRRLATGPVSSCRSNRIFLPARFA